MKYQHRVLGMLSLLAVITYLDRVCIAVAGPRMQDALQISPAAWGWVLSVFSLSYSAFEIPTGALVRQAGPGARIWREDFAGGGELRPDSGPGAHACRTSRYLPAELHQSVSHRRSEDDHRRDARPARLEPTRLDRASRRQSGQHRRVRQSAAGTARAGLHRPDAAAGGDSSRRRGAVLRADARARGRLSRGEPPADAGDGDQI